MRRKRKTARDMFKRNQMESKNMLDDIYFDGRKDETLTQSKVDHKTCRTTTTENHIVLVS